MRKISELSRRRFLQRSTAVLGAPLPLWEAANPKGAPDGGLNGGEDLVLRLSKARVLDGETWARSFRSANGTIYLLGPLKSVDGGKTIILCGKSDPQLDTALNCCYLNSFYSVPGLFLGYGYAVICDTPGRCVGKIWCSVNNLETIQREETKLFIPEAGICHNTDGSAPGLYFHRGTLEMADGSLVTVMFGNFVHDRIRATDPRSIAELGGGPTAYKMRVFLVRSTDQGKTWHYVSTVAAPRAGVVDHTEGFDESTIVRLSDGRLLVVMRTGNYTPLAASWSSDNGKTWTEPTTPQGLGPGVDPCLLRLSDGRLALSYGQTHPRHGPMLPDYRKEDQRRRCLLAINSDGTGGTWVVTTVADYALRGAYSTIYEVAPNVVYQAELNLWRIELRPGRKQYGNLDPPRRYFFG
jgi:BNR repeat-like domain